MAIERIAHEIRPAKGPVVPAASKLFIAKQILKMLGDKDKISYKELMEILLYDRSQGFYTKHLELGQHFSTRPIEFSPDYGHAFARKIARFVKIFDLSSPTLDFVALGDGNGIFLQDILKGLVKEHPALYKRFRKISVELVPRFTGAQKAILGKFGVNILTGSAVDLPFLPGSISGIVYANELIDQLPVNKVINRKGTLKERYLAFKGDRLTEIDGELSSSGLKEYFEITGEKPRSGRTCMVNLGALKLLENLSKIMRRGLIIFFDYNSQSPSLHGVTHTRFGGKAHLIPQNFEFAIGRDVTTDVDFEALKRIAKHFGFKVWFLKPENEFFCGVFPRHRLPSLGLPMKVLVLEKK
jgi:SAM-dependent MidA family methyltransferase